MPVSSSRGFPVTRWLGRDWQQKCVAALPIMLVNCVAVSGQLGFAHDHLSSWGDAGQLLFALAIESEALCLSYFGYLAEKANDSALRLKLASYGLGLAVGVINYSHYAPDWKPTAVAVVVGGMSSLSPWLWSVYSRRVSRSILASNGLIESHALRLGATRWMYHPIQSFKVARHASWIGESRITKAISAYDSMVADRAASQVAKSLDRELEEVTR